MSQSEREKKRVERLKKVGQICTAINNGKFGGPNKDACLFFGGAEVKSVERFPSGAKTLDWALGGGWPLGRICEVYGPEGGGKSTLCLHAIAEFQRAYPDVNVAIIDSEFSFDVDYAKALGVDVDILIIHQPESGEQALNVLEQLVYQGVRLIVVDSVAALVPQAELDGEIGDAHVATQARLMSQALKKLVGVVGRSEACILFTNQVREKIGVTWGKRTTEPGGRALKFYASCRVDVVAIGKEVEGEEVVSNRIKATVTKNKVAPPFREAHFVITFGHGIDQIAALLSEAIDRKVIKKKGAWFSMGNEQLGQGRANVLNRLREDAGFRQKLEEKLAEVGDSGTKQDDGKITKPVVGKAKQELPELDTNILDESTEEEEVTVEEIK